MMLVGSHFLCGRPHGADPYPTSTWAWPLRVDIINGWPLIHFGAKLLVSLSTLLSITKNSSISRITLTSVMHRLSFPRQGYTRKRWTSSSTRTAIADQMRNWCKQQSTTRKRKTSATTNWKTVPTLEMTAAPQPLEESD